MNCPKCGKENPENAQICFSCSAVLNPAPTTGKPDVKTSGLAIAALVLGIFSPFTCSITAIPAVILGIISLVKIEKSGGRLTGRGFAIAGIVVPVVVSFLMLGIIFPLLARVRQIGPRTGIHPRMVCGTNLSGIGKAMLIYANDYDDKFPCAAGPNSKWGPTPNWQADNRSDAYGLTGGADGQASISASLYLLVKYVEVTPKSFVCKGDSGTTELILDDYDVGDRDYMDLWDFGPEPWKHCSYSYHMPYGPYALTTSYLPGMAVAADRNPWLDSPAAKAKDFSRFKPDRTPWNGTTKQAKYGNAIAHQQDGQNVLFMDTHVAFEKRSFCGVKDDNIYTYWDGPDIQLGAPPRLDSQPAGRVDSLLVNDPPAAKRK